MGCCCAKAKNSDPALHKEPLIPNSALHEDEEAHCAGADVISSSAAVVEAYVPESEPFVERFSSKRSLKCPELLSDCDVGRNDASINPMHQMAPETETKSGEETASDQETAPGTEYWPGLQRAHEVGRSNRHTSFKLEPSLPPNVTTLLPDRTLA